MPTILLIDDDGAVRLFCRLVLEAAGYEVREAANGVLGLSAQHERPANLVVLDFYMPGKDGLATLGELLAHAPELKVILISGGTPRGPRDVWAEALRAGATAVLGKPFTPDQLLAAVTEALKIDGA